jgi:cyanophycinase
MDRHLFLFGGGPPFTNRLAKQFSELVSTRGGKVALFILERANWQEYMPKYTNALMEQGISEFQYIPLPTVSAEEASRIIQNSSGIIIGGGNTELYAEFIIKTPISTVLKEQFSAGVPIAGFSAGALICMDKCIISAKDNTDQVFKYQGGLGLLEDTVIAVHFSEWMEESHLRKAVMMFQPSLNFGMDEGTGLYFYNNKLLRKEGKGVYHLKNDQLEKIETQL